MKTHSHSSPAAHPLVHAALAACVLISAVEMQITFAQADPFCARATPNAPIRVSILAGDENVLEQAPVRRFLVEIRNRRYEDQKQVAQCHVGQSAGKRWCDVVSPPDGRRPGA